MSKVNTIKEIAKKIADNNDTNDYDHIPIGADSDNIDRPNGETVEETLLKMESKNIKPLKFTGASTATYDGTTEKTINIPSYTVFKGASASAAGNTGLVPAPVASTSRKYLRDDGTWGVPDTTSYTVMTGATISAAGKSGLVPVPSAGDVTRYLRADATWGTLGAAAFKGIVNNATTTEEGFVPDARVVKGLQDQVNTLNSALESNSGELGEYNKATWDAFKEKWNTLPNGWFNVLVDYTCFFGYKENVNAGSVIGIGRQQRRPGYMFRNGTTWTPNKFL